MEQDKNTITGKEASIIKTLVFFDMFDYPLTAFEIWQYMDLKSGLKEVLELLQDSAFLKSRIGAKDGYYFLKERPTVLASRLRRYHYSAAKFKKAARFIVLFRFVPWIRLAAMANMIGPENLRRLSDIDLFIVAAPQRVWLTRFFCAGLSKALNARPRPGQEQDKICLSFFISEDRLDLADLMLADDVYFWHWLIMLRPILDQDRSYERLIQANAAVINHFPNWRPPAPFGRRKVAAISNRFYFDVFEMFFGGLEKISRKFQLKVLASPLKEIINQDTRVVMDSQVLKMHPKDRREAYRASYRRKLKQIL